MRRVSTQIGAPARRRRFHSILGLHVGLVILAISATHQTGEAHWPHRSKKIETEILSGSPSQMSAAARSLGGLSRTLSKRAVLLCLRSDDAEVRRIGAEVALLHQHFDAAPVVIDWLKSTQVSERLLAVEILGMAPNETNVAALTSARGDPERAVRAAVAVSLGRSPVRLWGRAASALLSVMDDPEPQVRREVAAALGKVGDQSAVLPLAAHLKDPEGPVRAQLAVALGVLGEPSVVPALLVGLGDAEPSVVGAIAGALGNLGQESAVAGLISVAEERPFREPGERAVEALLRIGGDLAYDAVFDLLVQPEVASVVRVELRRGGAKSREFLDRCISKTAGKSLETCIELSLFLGGAADPVHAAFEEQRISASAVLRAFSGRESQRTLVLALEAVSSGSDAEAREALAYLSTLNELPAEAETPLVQALMTKKWARSDVVGFLTVLGQTKRAAPPEWMARYLDSTDSDVSAAAASLAVAWGAQGQTLHALLMTGPSHVRSGALSRLARGMTHAQADLLVRLVWEGIHGHRRAFLSAFSAIPPGLSATTQKRLQDLLSNAGGGERDAVLTALAPSLPSNILVDLAAHGDLGDKLRLAQLAWYLPQALPMAGALTNDPNPHVAASAVLALGRYGDANSMARLATLAKRASPDHRSTLVRVSALQALSLLQERGHSLEVDDELLSPETCESPRIELRLAALRLAHALGKVCGKRDVADLLHESNPFELRLGVARLLASTKAKSLPLRRCVAYEPRLEIVEACQGKESLPKAQPARPASFPLYEIVTWIPSNARRGAALMPVTLDRDGVSLRLTTDRSGRLLVPAGTAPEELGSPVF